MDLEILLRKIREETPCTIQIIGPRDSGKTLLITRLVRKLRELRKDLFVLIIKHTHHKQIDLVEKDTYRFLDADADAAVIISDKDYGIFSRRIDILSIIDVLKPDLVFVEGFKSYDIGFKIELREPGDAEAVFEYVFKYIINCLSMVEKES